ncbi:MAG: septum formation initiator family protein [Clostridia bacterium]|nr:septum formation initiator family protein [Clostridia bacterium]MBQ7121621.1 septum formation initiator family protein [Clostridia bacterium]
MTVKKVKNRKHSIILAVLFTALVCYFVATLISLQTKVRAEREAVTELSRQHQQQVDENSELAMIIENGDEDAYIEKIAREQYGYAMPDERVYYDS